MFIKMLESRKVWQLKDFVGVKYTCMIHFQKIYTIHVMLMYASRTHLFALRTNRNVSYIIVFLSEIGIEHISHIFLLD